jgi:magnesium transporter
VARPERTALARRLDLSMIQTVLTEGQPPKPIWLDVSAPTRAELEALARDYKLHATLVADCLEPMHLPKHERSGDVTFMIVRAFDDDARPTDDSVQALTRKVALFLGNRFLVAVHRKDQAFLGALSAKYRDGTSPIYLQVVLLEILAAAVETYQRPLEEAEGQVHAFQVAVLKARADTAHWVEVFRTQTRLLVIKRMLWHTLSAVQQFVPYSSANQPIHQDVRERIDSLLFFADSLLDDLRNLLSVQLALASHETNQVMRVLTVFSVFFMPITFLAGIYGMNFAHMPELGWRLGYPMAWGLMIGSSAVIYLWLRRKRWL